eukprot:EG_transcript_20662
MAAVVFLDIDGVLRIFQEGNQLDPNCLAALKAITDATGASIVLSSTWRLQDVGHRLLSHWFQRYGIPLYVDTTPNLFAGPPTAQTRAEEIAAWLRTHQHQVKSWVAIDDLPLDAAQPAVMAGHFVLCNPLEGLTMRGAQQAIHLLRGTGHASPAPHGVGHHSPKPAKGYYPNHDVYSPAKPTAAARHAPAHAHGALYPAAAAAQYGLPAAVRAGSHAPRAHHHHHHHHHRRGRSAHAHGAGMPRAVAW